MTYKAVINLKKGMDRFWDIEVVAGETPVDLRPAKLWFTVKEHVGLEDADALFQKRNEAAGGSAQEITVLNQIDYNVARVYVVKGDTSGADVGTYVYDLKVYTDDLGNRIPVEGPFILLRTVTKASG